MTVDIIDFSGKWKRTHVGELYDDFWKLQGHSWVKRKLAAKAHLHRTIEQSRFNVESDTQVFAGLLTISSSYPIHKSEEMAEKSRNEGNVVREEANGKVAHLVAWFDSTTKELCLYRTFENETYTVLFKHKLMDYDTLHLTLTASNQNESVTTSTTYQRE
uniref:Uncharacterized protein n=1 Tax=Vannella robusta TaxID=1487602 RepID=A0A7S4M8Z6_9EUKA|mmetsp:Transcript_15119/g.19123  ORF Transcript_15119/g.19123 Transcript_15119/m.19123 type:complete len:160 (+) Transcript_15119:170-649(+)